MKDKTKAELLRHALGATNYRNHFVTSPGTTDFPYWEEMVVDGLATRRDDPLNEMSTSYCYHVTPKGKAWLEEHENLNP